MLALHLRDQSPSRVAAWRAHFEDRSEVDVSEGPIFHRTADALVSPANSFGYMDGGIDLVYVEHFGWDLEDRVRQAIAEDWGGELPVGCALIVPTGRPEGDIRWLICAPTMRVPMNVARTPNAYLAFRAALRAVQAHNEGPLRSIASVMSPGLGTGVGRMPAELCARQMRAAWDEVVHGLRDRLGGLAGEARRHMSLLGLE
ncbi:MAG: macro domain-containing protein [Myxococcota bacterium]